MNLYFEGTWRQQTKPATSHHTNHTKHVERDFGLSTRSWLCLLGRRVTLGYTLSGGDARRNISLRFKQEGVLLESKNKPSRSQLSSSLFGTKKKEKFTAANLLFECYSSSQQVVGYLPPCLSDPLQGVRITGRLSNLLCRSA